MEDGYEGTHFNLKMLREQKGRHLLADISRNFKFLIKSWLALAMAMLVAHW